MSDLPDNVENTSNLNHDYDWQTGKMTPKGGANPQDPNRVPMGTGIAQKGKQIISGRQKQIDDAVAAAGG